MYIRFFFFIIVFREQDDGENASPELARVWFEYGNALLLKEEENPSVDLLGTVASEARKAASELAIEIQEVMPTE